MGRKRKKKKRFGSVADRWSSEKQKGDIPRPSEKENDRETERFLGAVVKSHSPRNNGGAQTE